MQQFFSLPDSVTGYALGRLDSLFSVIYPEETINLIKNPSFEHKIWNLGYFSSGFDKSTSNVPRGKVCAASNTSGNSIYTQVSVSYGTYAFSCDIFAKGNYRISIIGSQTQNYTYSANNEWQRVSILCQVTSESTLTISLVNLSNSELLTDGWQFEKKPYSTTYCDGSVSGNNIFEKQYWWSGQPNNSTSYRSKNTRHGGKIIPLANGKNAWLVSYSGFGAPPTENSNTVLSSGRLYVSRVLKKPRELSIVIALYAESAADLAKARSELIDLFTYSPTSQVQPVTLLCSKPDDKSKKIYKINVFYEGGLEGIGDSLFSERIAIKLISEVNYFQEEYQTKNSIPFTNFTNPSTLGPYVFLRNEDGSYQGLGDNSYLPSWPSDLYIPTTFYGEKLIVGGNFPNVSNAQLRYIKIWDGTWSPVSTGVNNIVTALKCGSNTDNEHANRLFVGGYFTGNYNSTSVLKGLAILDIDSSASTATWSTLNVGFKTEISGPSFSITPDGRSVNTFSIHSNGKVYVGGSFTHSLYLDNNIWEEQACPGVAYLTWDDNGVLSIEPLKNSSNQIIGISNTSTITDSIVGPDGLVYFAGSFTMFGGVAAKGIVAYDPVSRNIFPIGSRFVNSEVASITFDSNGNLIAAGTFSDSNTGPYYHLAKYNGFEWVYLGEPNSSIYLGAYSVRNAEDKLFVAGSMNSPSYAMTRYFQNANYQSDIILPSIWAGNISVSDSGKVAFSRIRDGLSPNSQPYSLTTYYPIISSITVDEDSEWQVVISGPCKVNSFSNLTTNSSIFFSDLIIRQDEDLYFGLKNGYIFANSTYQGSVLNRIYNYTSSPTSLMLKSGKNNLQISISNYLSTSPIYASVSISSFVKSLDH